MSTYNLKDKINNTNGLLQELSDKSWLEIEHLQNQIANIEVNKETDALVQLLKNLLTSYYVFAGGLETLSSDSELSDYVKQEDSNDTESSDLITSEIINSEPQVQKVFSAKDLSVINDIDDSSEPFEYFVDFDEPIGEPLSDEDLYGKM